jgi:hypothetical protein
MGEGERRRNMDGHGTLVGVEEEGFWNEPNGRGFEKISIPRRRERRELPFGGGG